MIVFLIWVVICGSSLYLIERKLENLKDPLQYQKSLLVARRLCFFLVSLGLGVLAYQSFTELIVFSWLSSSQDAVVSTRLIAWVVLVVLLIPTVMSCLATFFKKLSRITYITFSAYILPAFLGLLCLSIYRRYKRGRVQNFFPTNSWVILSSWGILLCMVVIQTTLLTFWFPTQQEMEAEEQQRLDKATEYVHQQTEYEQLLEGRIEQFDLLYTEDWQRSVDHRKIIVHISGQGQSTITVQKSGNVTTSEPFDYPKDALTNLIESLASDSFQSLQDQYCQSSGKCLNDSATYTLTINLDGKEKTVMWSRGDPQIQETILDTIGVTILRYVPVNIYD